MPGKVIGRSIFAVQFFAYTCQQWIHPGEKFLGREAPSEVFHIHLWPIAQMLRLTFFASVMPQSVAATMSQCSKAEMNFERLAELWRSQWRSLEKPHSDE